jgi:uncharacterized membrane protein (DUF373 family)
LACAAGSGRLVLREKLMRESTSRHHSHLFRGANLQAAAGGAVRELWRSFDALVLFGRAVDLFFKLLILFVLVVLAIGLARMFLEVWSNMAGRDLKDAFGYTVTNLLTFFVLLELFKSLVEYFREHRLKLTFIVDATLVFILRELMIGLYQHQNAPLQIAALSMLLLTLAGVRTLAIVYSPMERRMVRSLGHDPAEAARVRSEERSEAASAPASAPWVRHRDRPGGND